MAGNTFGTLYRLTTFGESHGEAIGGIIDGCPPGLLIDEMYIQQQLNRRRPGQSALVTPRDEKDKLIFLSGVFEGKSTGVPISFMIRNENQQPKDYDHLKDVFRPSHADYTYQQKYGHRDYRGSGRASARETIARVVGGAIATLWLKKYGITINAYVSQIGSVKLNLHNIDFNLIDSNEVRCPDNNTALQMMEEIKKNQQQGDTLGGIISCVIDGVPAGLGEPVFDKLQADLGKAMLSINAVKGFEYGSGFAGAAQKGSTQNDAMEIKNGKLFFLSNNSGGIQGGISNGAPIYFNVAFKPISSIKQKQNSITKQFTNTEISVSGRHDVCVVPRAVPIVEAMSAMVIMDFMLRQNAVK
ncbi:MAG: chorismate synthase [Bacteroidia bacterium]|nr:chorismate synthase [Bacteroidia bacterium]MCZ2249839.1 chorismate synthase [Bacteroidia bacterium]